MKKFEQVQVVVSVGCVLFCFLAKSGFRPFENLPNILFTDNKVHITIQP